MKFTIERKKLEKHINKISKAMVQYAVLYSLSGVLITCNESYIELLSSDGNLSIRDRIELDNDTIVEKTGQILINAFMFKNIIKKQGENIVIEEKDNDIYIYSKGNKVKINSFDPHSYPNIDFSLIGSRIVLEADEFKKLIKNVSFAASDNDKRIILNGVNLKTKEDQLIISATNSYRLATGQIKVHSEKDFNITILAKNLKEFLPTNLSGQVEIQVDDNKINLKEGNTIIQSKLIDGLFPELERLIPNEYQSTLKIESKVFIDLLEKATVISSSLSPVRLEINKDLLTLESNRDQIGNSKIEYTEFDYDGEHFGISFDSNFMKEALKTFSGLVEINFVGDLKPIIIKSESNEDLTQLILPHRNY